MSTDGGGSHLSDGAQIDDRVAPPIPSPGRWLLIALVALVIGPAVVVGGIAWVHREYAWSDSLQAHGSMASADVWFVDPSQTHNAQHLCVQYLVRNDVETPCVPVQRVAGVRAMSTLQVESGDKPSPDQVVTVLYDPRHPSRALVLDNVGDTTDSIPGWFIAAGVLVTLYGLVALVKAEVFRQRRNLGARTQVLALASEGVTPVRPPPPSASSATAAPGSGTGLVGSVEFPWAPGQRRFSDAGSVVADPRPRLHAVRGSGGAARCGMPAAALAPTMRPWATGGARVRRCPSCSELTATPGRPEVAPGSGDGDRDGWRFGLSRPEVWSWVLVWGCCGGFVLPFWQVAAFTAGPFGLASVLRGLAVLVFISLPVGWVLWRLVRRATVVDRGGVTARGFLRTRRLRWAEIQGFANYTAGGYFRLAVTTVSNTQVKLPSVVGPSKVASQAVATVSSYTLGFLDIDLEADAAPTGGPGRTSGGPSSELVDGSITRQTDGRPQGVVELPSAAGDGAGGARTGRRRSVATMHATGADGRPQCGEATGTLVPTFGLWRRGDASRPRCCPRCVALAPPVRHWAPPLPPGLRPPRAGSGVQWGVSKGTWADGWGMLLVWFASVGWIFFLPPLTVLGNGHGSTASVMGFAALSLVTIVPAVWVPRRWIRMRTAMDADGVTIVGLWRTRRYGWNEIVEFDWRSQKPAGVHLRTRNNERVGLVEVGRGGQVGAPAKAEALNRAFGLPRDPWVARGPA